MPIPRLFLTATFRLAMAFTVVFVAGVFALLLVLQWAVSSYASQATDDTLRSEMALIQAEAAQVAHHLQTVAAGQHAVDDQHIVGPGLGHELPGRAVGRHVGGVTGFAQAPPDIVRSATIILDDQDPHAGGHLCPHGSIAARAEPTRSRSHKGKAKSQAPTWRSRKRTSRASELAGSRTWSPSNLMLMRKADP